MQQLRAEPEQPMTGQMRKEQVKLQQWLMLQLRVQVTSQKQSLAGLQKEQHLTAVCQSQSWGHWQQVAAVAVHH